MESEKQWNRLRVPAVAGEGLRRSARRPFSCSSRAFAARVISVHRHGWLRRVRHETHRRSATAVLARGPAPVRCSGYGPGRKPGSIQHVRFCPHPAGLRSRPVRQELGASATVARANPCSRRQNDSVECNEQGARSSRHQESRRSDRALTESGPGAKARRTDAKRRALS